MATGYAERSPHDTVREVSRDEGRAMFEQTCQRELGISGEEFLERWHRGDYDNSEDPNVFSVAIMIPFAR